MYLYIVNKDKILKMSVDYTLLIHITLIPLILFQQVV